MPGEYVYLVTGTAILTDDLFNQYGGSANLFDTATPSQRNLAYMMAEQLVVEEIGTLLSPTTLTGTFNLPADWRLLLPFKFVRSVSSVTLIHEAGCDCADDAVELSGCAWLRQADAGIINLVECGRWVQGSIACGCFNRGDGGPIQVRVVFSAGHQNVANMPGPMMGLVTMADLMMEQIVDPAGAHGGPGDPSLASFSDSGYSASYQFLQDTALGGSPRANFAARMLEPLKFRRALRL